MRRYIRCGIYEEKIVFLVWAQYKSCLYASDIKLYIFVDPITTFDSIYTIFLRSALVNWKSINLLFCGLSSESCFFATHSRSLCLFIVKLYFFIPSTTLWLCAFLFILMLYVDNCNGFLIVIGFLISFFNK